MALIVTVDSERYIVDVGYGVEQALLPIPLTPHVFKIPLNRTASLSLRSLPFHTARNQSLWVYSVTDVATGEERAQYALSEMELCEADYEFINYCTSTKPGFIMCENILALKATMENGEITGMYTLMNDEVKQRKNDGSKVVVEKFKNEAERVAALDKYFGIVLSNDERDAIKGTVTALS